ncbi:hypothetical protein BDF19DRAFT_450690 [Syncephalis fuscata]|nr:hypothetical protein BDF19DRAFT_450690 [Syncephalis fuscata]
MSCDLTDIKISEAYDDIANGGDTNWMIMGYRDTRDVITLYHQGAGGLEELHQHLSDEVLYGFVRIDEHVVLFTYMNEQVSARALVHGRTVNSMFKSSLQIPASSKGELSETGIRVRLRQLSSDATSPTATAPASPSVPIPVVEAATPESDLDDEADPELESESAAAESDTEPAMAPPASSPPPSNPPPALPESADAPAVSAKSASPPVSNGSAQARTTITAVATQEEIEDQEAEKQRKLAEEAERQRREQLQQKMLQADKSNKGDQLSGYITVQGGGCYIWKRRYFVIKSKTMFLYRDETDKLPVAIADAQEEVLIPNTAEPFFFFADTPEQKVATIQGIQKCA